MWWTSGRCLGCAAAAAAAAVSPFLACIGSPCLRHRVHGASIGDELGTWARAHLAGRAALDVGAELLSQSAVPRRELALLLARCTGLRTLSWGECY